MKKWLNKVVPVTLITFPLLASAQFGGISDLIRAAGTLVRSLILLVAGIALLVFFWGIVKFIVAQGSETAKAEAKKIMGWGLIALFVMVSVWGIIRFFQRELLPAGTDFSAPPGIGGQGTVF